MSGNKNKVKVNTSCDKEIIVDKNSVYEDSLGFHIDCPYKNSGCNGTCDVDIVDNEKTKTS